MRKLHLACAFVAVLGVALLLISRSPMSAQQAGGAIPIDNDDLGGTVTGPKGPEAGVWVIAETSDLPTKFVKIVVTDDRGRYLIPDLPKASYNVWVRGYGLVDSPKTQTVAGKDHESHGGAGPQPASRRRVLPGGILVLVDEGSRQERVPRHRRYRATESRRPCSRRPSGCARSSQEAAPRVIRLAPKGCAKFRKSSARSHSSVAAWDRRIQSGQAGGQMNAGLNNFGRRRALEMFADWTDRIAAGEVPLAPPRPRGVERNIVITQWDWADPKSYLHDSVTTDRRNPRLNPYGPIYGALELSSDYVPVLDPVKHTVSRIPLSVRDPNTPPTNPKMPQPSPYWGDEVIWTSKNNVHNPMLDEKNRLWLTSAVRPSENPDFCKAGSTHPSAKLFPVNNASRHLQMYDPQTKKLTHISTCFATHHLMFAEDANRTLWTSGGGQVIGWLNTKKFDETGDEVASQGWTALIVDTNGNGRRDAYVEPDQPVDPTKDKRINSPFYAASPAPDGSIWGSSLGFPGAIMRLVPGANPPETALTEIYELPAVSDPKADVLGFSPRGMDVDRNGIAWVALSSGHMASFDRRKCKAPLNGAKATGQHCREGWTFYPEPLPQTERGHRRRQRRGELLHVGRSVRHVRSWREHADQHRQRRRSAARAEGRQLGHDARAVSDGVLHEMDGRAHRRSRERLEGQRPVGHHQHAHAVPHGNRQGDDEQGDAVPGEA